MAEYGAIVGAGISAGANIFGAWLGNKLTKEREEEARAENYKYNEMSADNADARTRALYNDLYSPYAQLQQLKDAGLSPSLFYGDGGGISGQAGAMGSGASGINPHAYGVPNFDFSQVSKTMAEERLLDAEARKANAEANMIKPKAEATIANLLADAGYKKAAESVQKAVAAGQILQNYITENTTEAQITTICAYAEEAEHKAVTAYHEMRSAKCTADFNEETYNTHVQMATAQLDQVLQAILESKSNVRLNNQKISKLRSDVLRDIEETMIKWKHLDINERQFDKYEDWIDAQIPYIKDQIEIKLKELDIQNRRLITETIIGTLKALAIGASAASYTKGAQGSLTQPNPKEILTPKGKAVQHRSYQYQDIWSE